MSVIPYGTTHDMQIALDAARDELDDLEAENIRLRADNRELLEALTQACAALLEINTKLEALNASAESTT